jgi:hypothetical protein
VHERARAIDCVGPGDAVVDAPFVVPAGGDGMFAAVSGRHLALKRAIDSAASDANC